MKRLRRNVLVVDDEFLIALAFSTQVEAMGLPVSGTAATAQEAVALAQEHAPAVVLMDMRLKGEEDGVDAALEIHHTIGSKVIFITGSREQRTIDRIATDHPFAVLFKPITEHQLQATIADAMKAAFPPQEN